MKNIFSHRLAGIFFLILFPFLVEAQPAAVPDLHQNIQDVFNERGLEGVSSHYRTQRTEETTPAKK